MPHPLHAFVPDPAGFDPNASVISKPFELDDSADLRREIAEAEHTEWVIDAAARRALALLGQPSAALDAATDEALAVEVELALQQDAAKPDDVQLFPPAISQIDKDRAANARLLHKDDDLNPQAPSDWDMDGQGVVEAVEAEPDDPEKEALRARVAELEAQEPIIVEKIVERVVEVPVAAVVEAPTDGIPAEFRGLKLVEESPEKFTQRMKRRWQSLKHMQIDGTKPTNSRALPDMTEEEIAELADLEERNKTTRWLD